MRLPTRPFLLASAVLCLFTATEPGLAQSAATGAQPPSVLPPGTPTSAGAGLGAYFESPLAGVAFRPPEGAKQITRVANPDEIATFVTDEKGWTLKASRLRLSQPMALSAEPGSPLPGILQFYTDQLKQAPNAEVLRSDVTNVTSRGAPDTAMIAVRHLRGTNYLLTQQAIIQFSETVYYVLEFTSPGTKPGSGAASATDEEKEAVAMFSGIVDSVKLLDRSEVRRDQDERLFRTRTALINWTDTRIRKALVPERWLRIIQDGKDIGYTYVIEEETTRAGRKGFLAGARSRTTIDDQVDQESMLFVSFDRKFEEWSNVAQVTDKTGKRAAVTEIGTSILEERNVLDPTLKGGDERAKDDTQPPVRKVESYNLTVTYGGRAAAAPIQRQPPPWYLPQAMGQVLPRLLPLKEPKGYLFASYVTERREVVMRYVDVLPEATVTLGGRQVRAVPVQERIGIQGTPSVHYISPDGEYLGTVAESQKIVILPTTAADLQRIWLNRADLSRPNTDRPR